MSDWRGSGVDRCIKCGELYTFNRYFFPTYFQKDEMYRGDRDLICKFCLGQHGQVEKETE